MFKMIIYKLSQMIIVLFILTTITFILMKLSPDNPVDKILHLDISHVSHEQIETTENKLGLNNPIFIQWWHWLNQLFHFDLGTSYQTSEPVIREIANYLGPTLIITFGTLIVSLVISIPLGIIAAVYYHKIWDRIIRVMTSLSVSLPSFLSVLSYYIYLA